MSVYSIHLKNFMPIELNFLLYMHNVYVNCNSAEVTRFPGKLVPEGNFLPGDEYSEALRKAWYSLIKKYDNSEVTYTQLHCLIQEEFTWLFEDNSNRQKAVEELWGNFNLWWWPDYGIKSFMERISDSIVVPIEQRMTQLAKQQSHEILQAQFTLMVVFTKPPLSLKQNSSHLYIADLTEIFNPRSIEAISRSFIYGGASDR